MTHKNWRLFGFAFALLAFAAGSIWYVAQEFEREPVLTVAFLDVGQGDAIFIETPSGKQMLIDGGPNKTVVRQLSRVMPFFDRSIDVVVNTHPDRDHIGGLPEVLRRYEVARVLDSGVESDSGTYGYYRQLIEKNGITYTEARRGQIIDFGDGAYAEILFPDRDMGGVTNDNNASVVVHVVYASTSVMLTGDASKSIEEYLVSLDPSTGSGLQSDILKAGHHGSRTSSSEKFVGAVSPEWAIISAGKDNSYNHPHEEVMALFASSSIEALGTYDLGTIIFESDGKTFQRR